MRKALLLILRMLIAGAGIAYILTMLDWSDRVGVAPGTILGNGEVLVEGGSFPVVSGRLDPDRQGPLQIRIGPPPGDPGREPTTVTLTEAMLLADGTPFTLQPGIATTLRHARADYLLYSLLLLGLVYPLQTYRWGLLLRARGMAADTFRRFRLVLVGAFFNFCMPGSTGGDLVKAYYVARRSERRADAVMTVVMDRAVGLVALAPIAGIAGLFMLDDPVARRVAIGVWAALLSFALLCLIYTKGLGSRDGLRDLLRRLPGREAWDSADRAAMAYLDHKLALLAAASVSIPMHVSAILAAALLGYALGMEASFGMLLTILPLVLLAGAVPLTYQGLGVMEWIGAQLLVQPPLVLFNQMVGMLVIFRLCNVFYALLGSLFLVSHDIHLHPPQSDLSAADDPVRAAGEESERSAAGARRGGTGVA